MVGICIFLIIVIIRITHNIIGNLERFRFGLLNFCERWKVRPCVICIVFIFKIEKKETKQKLKKKKKEEQL